MTEPTRDPLQASRRELESAAWSGCRAVPVSGAILCRVLGRLLLYCDPADCSITPHLATVGYWEANVTLVVARTVKPGMVCVNVGANIGYYAALMASYSGPTGWVVALEPQPIPAALLERTKLTNGLGNLTVVSAAAGAAIGETILHTHPLLSGGGAVRPFPGLSAADRVPVVTVDSVTDGRPVDFVLIDAEGSEPDVWVGMRRTLRASPGPVVVAEWLPDRLADPEAFWDLVAYDGYAINRIDEAGDIYPLTRADALASPYENLWIIRR